MPRRGVKAPRLKHGPVGLGLGLGRDLGAAS